MAVFHRAAFEVVGLVVLAAEEIVRGDFRQRVEALGKAVFHGQAEGIEHVAAGVVALGERLAVLLGDAALVEVARRLALAFEAEQHRFDRHQLGQGLGQMRREIRLGDTGHGARQPRMPGMQGRGGNNCLGLAHARQSSDRAGPPQNRRTGHQLPL
ncbi:hypothetical protein D3C81_1625690 [compost metagenome]